MRVAIGGIWHETNTFVRRPTTIIDFETRALHYGDEVITRLSGTRTEIGGMIAGATLQGLRLEPTMFAGGLPSGMVTGETWLGLREDLVQRILDLSPVDGVLLSLHGAMVAEECDDPEGDLLETLRERIGAEVPIVATFDLHANVSQRMVTHADVLVGYDTCPHVDPFDRGVEAAAIMRRILEKGVRPAMALSKPGIIVLPRGAWTERPPMSDLMAIVHAWERDPRVICVSIAAGFPPADVECAGMGVIAVTNDDPELAKQIADEVASTAWSRRSEFVFSNYEVEAGVREAIGSSSDGLVVLVDLGDSVGAGAPGDGTVLLAELLRQGAQGAVVALEDPDVVDQAIQSGIGTEVDVAVGGKLDERHGTPVRMRARVRVISDGCFRYSGSYMTGQQVNTGRTVVLETVGENKVIVSERKTLPFDHEQLRSVGISPENCRIIVVKTAISWRAAYGDLAKRAIYVDTPGVASDDLSSFRFQKVSRPIYPLDE